MDKRFYSTSDPLKMRIGGETVEDLIKEQDLKYNDLTAYLPLTPEEVSKSKLNFIYLGYFEKWDPQECFYYSVENTGFQPASERSEGTYSKYTEIDDMIVPFHFYTTLIKFGIGRATYDASQEIRNDKINREEGVQLVRKYDEEFPSRSFSTFLEYLNISENDFIQTVDRFRPDYIWKSEGENEWKLVVGANYKGLGIYEGYLQAGPSHDPYKKHSFKKADSPYSYFYDTKNIKNEFIQQ
jgi:hypothetical protein